MDNEFEALENFFVKMEEFKTEQNGINELTAKSLKNLISNQEIVWTALELMDQRITELEKKVKGD